MVGSVEERPAQAQQYPPSMRAPAEEITHTGSGRLIVMMAEQGARQEAVARRAKPAGSGSETFCYYSWAGEMRCTLWRASGTACVFLL